MKFFTQILFVMIILSGILVSTYSQEPDTLWTKTFGGSSADNGADVVETPDGGYIICGETFSYGSGASDFWLIRTNEDGDTLWTKTYGLESSSYESANSIVLTSDGGFIIVGSIFTSTTNILLVRTDSNGDTLWTKTYGSFDSDNAYSILQTSDEGFIICGETRSYHQSGFGSSVWLIRTDSNGDTLWTKVYGGGSYQGGYSINQTADNGFIVTGSYNNGGATSTEVWLLKTEENGDTLWTKTYGGDGTQEGSAVLQTADSGYIVCGSSSWANIWLLRTDENGDTLWTKTYEGSVEKANSIAQIVDGGFIITGSNIDGDLIIIRTDTDGNEIWKKTLGGSDADMGSSIQQTSDGGYIVVGSTASYGTGNNDVWMIKVDADTPIPVELISFTASLRNGIELNWITATEKNNRGFEIQRKNLEVQNIEWKNIGFVNGFGTTTEFHTYSFSDKGVSSGSYIYRLKQTDFDGSYEYSNEIEINFTPVKFELFQNYPNPFNPTTKIKFTIPSYSPTFQGGVGEAGGGLVTLKIYDILGNEITTLVNEQKAPGTYEVEFNAGDLSSGVYFFKLKYGEFISIKKLMLMK